jgi:hypothetical protein
MLKDILETNNILLTGLTYRKRELGKQYDYAYYAE